MASAIVASVAAQARFVSSGNHCAEPAAPARIPAATKPARNGPQVAAEKGVERAPLPAPADASERRHHARQRVVAGEEVPERREKDLAGRGRAHQADAWVEDEAGAAGEVLTVAERDVRVVETDAVEGGDLEGEDGGDRGS